MQCKVDVEIHRYLSQMSQLSQMLLKTKKGRKVEKKTNQRAGRLRFEARLGSARNYSLAIAPFTWLRELCPGRSHWFPDLIRDETHGRDLAVRDRGPATKRPRPPSRSPATCFFEGNERRNERIVCFHVRAARLLFRSPFSSRERSFVKFASATNFLEMQKKQNSK